MSLTPVEALSRQTPLECVWDAATQASLHFNQAHLPPGSRMYHEELAKRAIRPDIRLVGGGLFTTLRVLLPLLKEGKIPVSKVLCPKPYIPTLNKVTGIGGKDGILLEAVTEENVDVDPPFILYFESPTGDPNVPAHVWFVADERSAVRDRGQHIDPSRGLTGIIVLGDRKERG